MDKRNKFFLIDTSLITLLAASSISGLLLWSVIPRRTGGLRWFLKDVHKWSGVGMAGLAFYHLILHWDWYKKTGRRLIIENNHQEDKKTKSGSGPECTRIRVYFLSLKFLIIFEGFF